VSISDFPVDPRRDRGRSTVGAVNGDRIDGGSDVFATLMWGLRRYLLLVLATVLALGVLIPLALSQRTAEYQATAQVGPTDALLLPNTNPLPRIAESVFNNGAVEVSVRTLLKQPSGNIIPSKVQLIAAQDNLVLEIVAHAPTAQEAIDIANNAAGVFVLELGRYSKSVATFAITHKAILAKKVPKVAGGSASIALGLVAGLLAGVALVGLLLVFRRPVVDVSTAQDVTGLPVIGRITLPRHGPPGAGDGRGIALLCRRLLAASASTIQVAAPSQAQAQVLVLSMTEAFGQMSAGRRPQKRTGAQGGSSVPPVPKVVAPEGTQAWISAPHEDSYTVLLVPEGISTRRLRLFAEGHDTGSPTGVVLVSTHGPGVKSLVVKG
jgi:hypothetical protein